MACNASQTALLKILFIIILLKAQKVTNSKLFCKQRRSKQCVMILYWLVYFEQITFLFFVIDRNKIVWKEWKRNLVFRKFSILMNESTFFKLHSLIVYFESKKMFQIVLREKSFFQFYLIHLQELFLNKIPHCTVLNSSFNFYYIISLIIVTSKLIKNFWILMYLWFEFSINCNYLLIATSETKQLKPLMFNHI